MILEVEQLLAEGLTPDQLKFYGLEYRYITRYTEGELTYDEMFRQLNTAIHQFAKRQITWFRKMEREGHVVHWIDGTLEPEDKLKVSLDLIRKKYLPA
jgi:tRNA dimethylallyltransferase